MPPNGERRPDPHPSGVKEIHHDSTTSVPQPLDPKRVPPGVAPLLKTWIGDLLARVVQQRDTDELRPCPHYGAFRAWPCYWMSWWPESLFCASCARAAGVAVESTESADGWPCARCSARGGSRLSVPVSGGAHGILNVAFGLCSSCMEEVAP